MHKLQSVRDKIRTAFKAHEAEDYLTAISALSNAQARALDIRNAEGRTAALQEVFLMRVKLGIPSCN